jgi:hypothetical protein
MAYFVILHEVTDQAAGQVYQLCLHKGILHHDDGTQDMGFRLMYRDATGKLLSHRGQALFDPAAVLRLFAKAVEAGWLGSSTNVTSLVPEPA